MRNFAVRHRLNTLNAVGQRQNEGIRLLDRLNFVDLDEEFAVQRRLRE